ncbi:ABC transporter substrate-binding protein [Leucothrix sargassi]|nr:ABC transporter substrate-binding protein [Leucothrix sargassi]
MKKWRLLLLICLLSFSAHAEQSRYLEVNQGGWLVRALKSRPVTLTPYLTAIAETQRINSYIYESLLRKNRQTNEWEGLLAKQWQVSEDGLSYRFTLHENIVFSDGEPMDASDVLFTYKFLMDEKMGIPGVRGSLKNIVSITAPSKYEVEVKYAEPFFRSLTLVGSLPILAEHYYEKYLKEPETFRASKALSFGTGPYLLDQEATQNLSGSQVVLKRNPRYWADSIGTFDKLVWKVYENSSARLVAYHNGEIDTLDVDPKDFESLKSDKHIIDSSNVFEFQRARQGYSYIAWNAMANGQQTFFADKRVRLAMTYLTDKQKIVDQVYKGFGEVADSPFSKLGKQHNSALIPREYNVAKALEILSELGFKDRDGDGVIENEAGKAFSFKLTYAQEREDSRLIALMTKDALARAGIEVLLDPQLSGRLYDMMDEKSFEALTSGWLGGLEVDIYYMFHSEQIEDSLYNFISYRSDALDKTVTLARKIVDEAERMKLWQQVHRILNEDQPYTFLVHRKSLQLVNKRIKNVKVTNTGLNVGLVPVEVYVPKSEQRYK